MGRTQVKYAFIRENSGEHKLARLIAVMGVSPSGYYDWLGRGESKRVKTDRVLLAKIREIYNGSCGLYGSPRIHKELVRSGQKVSVNRVARLMRREGIRSTMARGNNVIEASNSFSIPVFENLLWRVSEPP